MKFQVAIRSGLVWIVAVAIATIVTPSLWSQSQAKPNIVFIMGDDIGWFNIGAYHHGMMAGRTPNLDRLAGQGMMFTDYYAEASCTAGRANFITGELPIRTGLTTVGQAGATIGMPDQAPTIAIALKSLGYATGLSERIISVIEMSTSRRCTVLTNSGVTSTT
jgi:arylsulfatase